MEQPNTNTAQSMFSSPEKKLPMYTFFFFWFSFFLHLFFFGFLEALELAKGQSLSNSHTSIENRKVDQVKSLVQTVRAHFSLQKLYVMLAYLA